MGLRVQGAGPVVSYRVTSSGVCSPKECICQLSAWSVVGRPEDSCCCSSSILSSTAWVVSCNSANIGKLPSCCSLETVRCAASDY